jgi:hypothetical protein
MKLDTCKAATMSMASKKISKQGLTHPFGDHQSAKQQAFVPVAFKSDDWDPFSMCNYFDPKGNGPVQHEDDFPIN